MLTQSGFHNTLRVLAVCLLAALLISCGSRDRYTGTYKAEAPSLPRHAETIMELKTNGDGVWRVDDEEISFAWYVQGGELRINTKGGGVIVGAIDKDTIQVNLPGAGTMHFKKVQ
jgi:hypothetical protein